MQGAWQGNIYATKGADRDRLMSFILKDREARQETDCVRGFGLIWCRV